MGEVVASPSASRIVADVVVPRPLPQPLTYVVPEEFLDQVRPGAAVIVPFRSGTSEGFVVDVREEKCDAPREYALKNIKSVLDEGPVFTNQDLEFFRWIAAYYQTTLGEVFFTAIPKVMLATPKRARKTSSIEARVPTETRAPFELSSDQKNAYSHINAALLGAAFKSFLLFGVTGSGKTEVYLCAVEETLRLGKSAIILVPEIALTPQLRHRFESRFGDQVAVMHSSLGDAARRDFWRDLRTGKRRIAVGARSAIFAPLEKIGLIVVDEEHEPTYKQEGNLKYHARDLALVRARQHGAVTILGSATPSIETFHAALSGRHQLLELRERPASRPMPTVEVVDLKDERKAGLPPARNLGRRLVANLVETVARGEQAILFLNRKGYSSFLMCSDCGEVPGCDDCSVSLTYYRGAASLKCHYCGHSRQAPSECGKCFGRNFRYMGFGTESVEAELRELLPQARIGRLDAETASTSKKLEELLAAFRSGEIQVLVGTQMLAKGHDFPNVTLIGVVLAEMGLHIPDFRAGERTFQLLCQVAGRAGRGDLPGHVIIQTYIPETAVIQHAMSHNYRAFFDEELQIRREFGYPPFSRMAQIEFKSRNEVEARRDAERLAALLRELGSDEHKLDLLGPAPAGIAKVAGEHRWHLLLKSEKISSLNAFLKTARRAGARHIDVDPASTV